MIKHGKSFCMSKRAFTLVELIVVLVILAILAAMLVPALTGYIKKARFQKDLQMASTYRTAAQSVLTEMYARGEWVGWDRSKNPSTNRNVTSYAWKTDYGNRLLNLVNGVDNHPYLLYIQCGRYPWYGDHSSPDCTSETEYYAYTCFRIYYQADKNSGLVIIDDTGVYDVESYAALDRDHSCRDWVLDSDGNKIYTVVYAIEHGPNSNPAFNLSQIEQGTYGQ